MMLSLVCVMVYACLAMVHGIHDSTCPSGWTLYSEQRLCFKYVSSNKGWFDARIDCETQNGELPIMYSQKTAEFIRDNMNPGRTISTYYTGLRSSRKGNFRWLDLTMPDMNKYQNKGYINRYKTFPKDGNKYCWYGSFNSIMVYNTSCLTKLPYICQKKAVFRQKPNCMERCLNINVDNMFDRITDILWISRCKDDCREVDFPCPRKVIKNKDEIKSTAVIDKRCYSFSKHRMNFEDASKACKAYKGQLVMTKTVEINKKIYHKRNEIYTNQNDKNAWLGLKYNGKKYKWSDGTPLGKYTNFFNKTKPKDKNCVEHSSALGQWLRKECEYINLIVHGGGISRIRQVPSEKYYICQF